VEWDEEQGILTGVSRVVGGDPYTMTIATNGYDPGVVSCQDQKTEGTLSQAEDGLVRLTLERDENAEVEWSVVFERHP
jgi:hypothetical protein